MMDRDYYMDSLKKSNFKITPQRVTVIDYIREHSPGHFTVEEIYRSIHVKEPSITLATVYNILKALQSTGTVRSLELNGATWFETNTNFHGNFVCNVCGNISDLEVDQGALLSSLTSSGYEVEQASLIIRGVCRECRKKN